MLQPVISPQLGAQGSAFGGAEASRDYQRQHRLHGEIGSFTATPIVHTVELLDWANGGPPPLVH